MVQKVGLPDRRRISQGPPTFALKSRTNHRRNLSCPYSRIRGDYFRPFWLPGFLPVKRPGCRKVGPCSIPKEGGLAGACVKALRVMHLHIRTFAVKCHMWARTRNHSSFNPEPYETYKTVCATKKRPPPFLQARNGTGVLRFRNSEIPKLYKLKRLKDLKYLKD